MAYAAPSSLSYSSISAIVEPFRDLERQGLLERDAENSQLRVLYFHGCIDRESCNCISIWHLLFIFTLTIFAHA